MALCRDEHQLVFVRDGEGADNVAGFLAGLHRDNAFAAAGLAAVVVERRSFANPILARDQQHRVWIDNRNRHDVVLFVWPNPPHAHRVAPLIAQLFLVKAQAHSFLCDQDDFVVAVRKFRVD